MKMKVDNNHHMTMQVERDDAAEKRWGDGLEKTLMNEHPTRAGIRDRMMRLDSFDRLAIAEQQQQYQEQQQYQDPSHNYARSAPARRDINATKSSRRLMRQVSGLGMEDPVFGTVEKTELQHPSNIFDDMKLTDVPEDMRDLVSIASDPTAAANGAPGARGQGLFDTEKFHASLGVDFYASISDFSLMELDLTPPTAAATATAPTTSRYMQETKTVVTPDSHDERNALNVWMEVEEEVPDDTLNSSMPSLSLSNILSPAPDTRKAVVVTAATPSSPVRKQRAALGGSRGKQAGPRQGKTKKSVAPASPKSRSKTRRPLPQAFPPATAVTPDYDRLMMEAAAMAPNKMDGHHASSPGRGSPQNSPRQQKLHGQRQQKSPKPSISSKTDRRGSTGGGAIGGGVRKNSPCKRKSSCKTATTATSEFSMIVEAAATTSAPKPRAVRPSQRCSTVAGTELATCTGGNGNNINMNSNQTGSSCVPVPYQVEKAVSLISAKQRTMPQLSSLFPTRAPATGAGTAKAKATSAKAKTTSATTTPSSPLRRPRGRISHKDNNRSSPVRSPITSTLFTSSHTTPPPGATCVNHILQTTR